MHQKKNDKIKLGIRRKVERIFHWQWVRILSVLSFYRFQHKFKIYYLNASINDRILFYVYIFTLKQNEHSIRIYYNNRNDNIYHIYESSNRIKCKQTKFTHHYRFTHWNDSSTFRTFCVSISNFSTVDESCKTFVGGCFSQSLKKWEISRKLFVDSQTGIQKRTYSNNSPDISFSFGSTAK